MSRQTSFAAKIPHILETGEQVACVFRVMPRRFTRSLLVADFGGLVGDAIGGVAGLITSGLTKGAAEMMAGQDDASAPLASYFPSRDRIYVSADAKTYMPTDIFFIITDRRYIAIANAPSLLRARLHMVVAYGPGAVNSIALSHGGPLYRRTTVVFMDGSKVEFDLPRTWVKATQVADAIKNLQ